MKIAFKNVGLFRSFCTIPRHHSTVSYNKPCARSSCPNLALPNEPYCAACTKRNTKRYYQARNKSYQHLYSSRWRKASKSFIACNPLCAECLKQGRQTPATVTDHIVPHKGDTTTFWDVSNWQALCKRCHDTKTSKEGAFGKEQPK